MNKRRAFIALCVAALLTGAYAFARRSSAAAGQQQQQQQSQHPARPSAPFSAAGVDRRMVPQGSAANGATEQQLRQQPSRPAPEHALYDELFFHVNFLGRKAAEKEGRGEDAKELRGFYTKQAKLDAKQTAELARVAADVARELDVLDRKAAKVVKKFRAEVQAMDLQPGQLPPSPPEELRAMQQQRDAAVLRGRDTLRARLGEEGFSRVDAYARQYIAPRITSTKFDRPRPENNGRPR